MDEKRLIHRAKKGDATAFEQLMVVYEKQVYNLVLRMVGNSEDALDVSQEAFLKAWRGLEHYRSDAKFSTWLYRLATNAAIDFIRREKRAKVISISQEEGEIDVVDRQANTFDQVSQKIDRETMGKAMEQLEPEYREALVLRVVNGLSYREIGAVTDTKEGTVKSRIARAREKMRYLMERNGNKTEKSSSNKGERG